MALADSKLPLVESPTSNFEFPSGINKSDYKSSANWSNRRWAWEFLRRNKEFQKFCHKVENGDLSGSELNKELLENFGLLKFRHYKVSESVPLPKFCSAQVGFFSGLPPCAEKNYRRVRVSEDEIVFRVNLKSVALSAKSLNAQIRNIKKILEQKSKIWLAEKGATRKATVQRVEFLPLIRLLDMVRYVDNLNAKDKITRNEMYAMLFPEITRTPNGVKPDPSQYDKPFNQKYNLARKYTTPERYLDLASTK